MKYLCYDSALNEEYTLIQLMQRYPKHISLFAGTDDEGIWDAAPWLFPLNNNPFDLKKDAMVQIQRCIVFETKEPLKNMLDYLQSKIYIKEKEQDKFFRIWDAKVLLQNLPMWEPSEIHDFFTIFDAFYTDSDEENFLNKWQWKGSNKIEAIKISKAEALPVIKTEEDLDREYEEINRPKTAITAPERKEKKQEVFIEKVEEEKPKRRKFFMD